MKTFNLPSIFKSTAVLLLFTLFGFQQANAQLNVINNTGCWVIVGEYYGNGCNICNAPAGTWIAPLFGVPQPLPVPPCLVSVVPTPGWIAAKYAVAPFPSPFATGPGSFTNNPWNGACFPSSQNSRCNAVFPVTANWDTPNTLRFQ